MSIGILTAVVCSYNIGLFCLYLSFPAWPFAFPVEYDPISKEDPLNKTLGYIQC